MKNKSLIKIVKIPKIEDDAFLFFAETPTQVPFKIERIYFITEPVKGLPRGKHAHRKTKQLLFCIKGKVRMVLDNGEKSEQVVLSSPEKGLLIDSKVWHDMLDMNEETLLLVLASEKYDPKDYIRDYDEFLKFVGKKRHD